MSVTAIATIRDFQKEHLLKAIEKIDNEGVPSNADSQYYDVLHNGNRYPPKLIVSYANLFANGEELDRKTFSGGKDTPCFQVLEKHGFEIVDKENPKSAKEQKSKQGSYY